MVRETETAESYNSAVSVMLSFLGGWPLPHPVGLVVFALLVEVIRECQARSKIVFVLGKGGKEGFAQIHDGSFRAAVKPGLCHT